MIRYISYSLLSVLLISASPRTLYRSIDPQSIEQHLALAYLYTNSEDGRRALEDVAHLLQINSSQPLSTILPSLLLPQKDARSVAIIDTSAQKLGNRKLKGHGITSKDEILNLTPDQIDLSRALLLCELGEIDKVKNYEATLDLMALQLLAKLPSNASCAHKIASLNTLLFDKLGYRFPPKTRFENKINEYTFLHNVMDTQRGICLGVTILYLCLAQRIDLPLEIITPPGHIFLSCSKESSPINIETTARGIHLDDEVYLKVDSRSLQKRNIKEVIGLAYFNNGTMHWQRDDFKGALESYHEAQKYMGDDPMLLELIGLCAVMQGETDYGKKVMQAAIQLNSPHSFHRHSGPADYLKGLIDNDGLLTAYKSAEEPRESQEQKRIELENTVRKYPRFRMGLLQLAATYMELQQADKALQTLNRYHDLDSEDITVEYFLAELSISRHDCNKAWEHLRRAEELSAIHQLHARPLEELRTNLMSICAE